MLGRQQSFTIAANDQLTEAAPYNDVIIAYRNGAPVRVRDVGQAIDGPQDVTLGALHREQTAVMLLVFKQPGANVIDTVDNIKAALASMHSLIPPGIHLDTDRRPHPDDSRRRQGRRIHAAAVVRAGRAGDPAVPAQHPRHAHSRRRGAAVAARRDRGHLSGRLQPRQSVADGVDHRRRLRRRRRHRGGGKHLPPSRSRHHAAAIGHQGRARDRLHRHFDQHLADRRVHPAAADERHRRTAVPRIRHHRDRGDRWCRSSCR